MICAKCGSSNSDSATSCDTCGQSLITFAPTSSDANVATAVLNEEYAGFWRRFAAVFLDGLILGLIFIPFAFGIGFVSGMAGLGNSPALSAAIYFVSFAASAAYYVAMESGAQGATYGKRWVKIKVVDLYGERIGKGRAFARWISHILSYITLYVGFLIQPFTARKQALHDMVSGTIIVRTENGRSGTTIVVVVVALFSIAILGILAAIAIPAYQDYVVKAKVMKAVEIAKTASKAVEAYYIRTGRVPASLAETNTFIRTSSDISGVIVNSNTGEVRVVFSSGLLPSFGSKQLSLTPTQLQDGSIEWKCSSDVQERYLPAACK